VSSVVLGLVLVARGEPLELETNVELAALDVAVRAPLDGSRWDLHPSGTEVVQLVGPDAPMAPGHVDLAVGEPAHGVSFAWAARGDALPGQRVGALEVMWSDGVRDSVPLAVGEQVGLLHDPETLEGARLWWIGADAAVSVWTWWNPRPEVPIEQLRVRGKRGPVSLVLVAASTFDGAPADSLLTPARAAAGRPVEVRPELALPSPEAWRVEGPAGHRGFVGVHDGHLGFEDGERARFWGINLLNEVALPTHEEADVLASQLADAGFNMARLHHVDGSRAGLVGPGGFDAEALDRFDYLVARLKEEGLYLFLEVASSKGFGEEDGVTPPYDGVPNGHKLVSMFEPTWTAAYETWLRTWLDRENPYTGLRLADDPGIAVVELGNEHSLVGAWLSGGLERLPDAHRASLDARWNAWLAERYPDAEALSAAWQGELRSGLLPTEAWGEVQRAPVASMHVDGWPDGRVRDLYHFYAELEALFYARMHAAVEGLGFRVPVTSTAVARPEAAVLHALRDDYVDTHAYWDQVVRRTSLTDRSMVATGSDPVLVRTLLAAEAGKPFTVSEFNNAHPNHASAEAPLTWAALAAVQDWDALVWLNYTNGPYREAPAEIAGIWELHADPVRWGQMPVASAVFRGALVASAPGLRVVHTDPSRMAGRVVSRRAPGAPELDDIAFWLAHRVRSSRTSTVAALDTAGAANGDLGWWPEANQLVIDTDALDAVVGGPGVVPAGAGEGAGAVTASHVAVELDGFSAVSLVNLEGHSLDEGGPALLTVAGRTWNQGQVLSAHGTRILAWGADGTVATLPAGEVLVRWPRRPDIRRWTDEGPVGEPLEAHRRGGGWWAVEPSAEALHYLVR